MNTPPTLAFLTRLYLSTLVVFLAIDLAWLGLAARGFYRKYLGFLMSPTPNWAAAGAFYLLFVGGLLYFAVLPGLQSGSLGKALLNGALFGLLTYATYDLTNLATLKDWPVVLTLVDIAWGVILSSLVTAAGYWLGVRLG